MADAIAVVDSLLDTDLYKLTMQAVVMQNFPNAKADYTLYNRDPEMRLNKEAVAWLKAQLSLFQNLRLQPEERAWLEKTVSIFSKEYLDELMTLRLDPENELDIIHDNDTEALTIHVSGLWKNVILYEVPLLALVSEAYFRFVDTDWTLGGQDTLASKKCMTFLENGCLFSEFGTRRRRSKAGQEIVIKAMAATAKEHPHLSGKMIGTSNVQFAQKYDLTPIGTVAHELFMGVAALSKGDYRNANEATMKVWLDTVGTASAGLALTDTFGTNEFLRVFKKPYTDYYRGVRQDSGDPVKFTKMVAEHYQKLGYPPRSKSILYSDSLNLSRCLQYQKVAEEFGILPAFGVGTFLTNDYRNSAGAVSKPLNIVMKISRVDGYECVKLSDDLGKVTGDPDEVQKAVEQVMHPNAKLASDH